MIKTIQKQLNIPETGIYDEFTEAAVRNFQLKTNIPVTGIIDNLTKEKLLQDDSDGKIDSDLYSISLIRQYNLPKSEYFVGSKPRAIFLHHTAGWNNPYQVVDTWAKDTRGKIGTAFVIGGTNFKTGDTQYDGDIVQAFPTTGYAWHLGIGNTDLHRNSIGIELCNFGYLTKSNGKYLTYTGQSVPTSDVAKLVNPFRGFQYFHKYTASQISAVKWLLSELASRTGVDVTEGLKSRLKRNKDVNFAFEYDPEISSGRLNGLFSHTNVSPKNKYGGYDKWDIFPQSEMVDMILSL